MRKLLFLILPLILFSCEKEQCYPVVQKDHIIYTSKGDTIKVLDENIRIFEYCGDVEQWANDQSFRVTTLYYCGGIVDGVHYEPLTIEITYMTTYIKNETN